MNETVLVPGGRDVRATLDRARTETGGVDADAVVVACPPHPQQRGHRGDERLVAVSDALVDRGIDCLRFDYGPWDDGYGECTDADNAVGWALERYDRVGLFGFSFGGCVALVTAAIRPELAAVCSLAPAARLNPDADAVDALDRLRVPARVVYGTRDTTADWRPVVERARERGVETVGIEADHFFVGRAGDVAAEAVGFLAPRLRDGNEGGD
ncbi:alpha/beta hydrolase [Halorubrum sp. JWXQ-INN 858]|uniref:alpha/beta hydrolase n=1 Tax=Halorubrum sp. JWXQ-INN 858 TaxID=2690782 RepID=UPI0013F753DF|nr:alpha/beta hydrolase [Halorubrum sp. JWXQ-INN 858]MWV63248.1 alpha/beta hydrolase [Halorubrum sp. JWXQ-INN 858]